MRLHRLVAIALLLSCGLLVAGCATVDVTKTAKGFQAATNANDVAILMIVPKQPFTEIATVSTTRWKPGETAKMYNALRAKTAPFGADAVILLNQGIDPNGHLWSTGVAIRYNR